jgi:hypothetical protein
MSVCVGLITPFSFLRVLLKPQMRPLSHALFAFLPFHLLLRQSLDEKSNLHSPFSSRQRKNDGFFVSLWILGEFDSENSSDPRKQAFLPLKQTKKRVTSVNFRFQTCKQAFLPLKSESDRGGLHNRKTFQTCKQAFLPLKILIILLVVVVAIVSNLQAGISPFKGPCS